jgi:heme/copper-type cytochrome/quinol oxidase subunit 2
MSPESMRLIGLGVFALVVGCLLIVFRERFARATMEGNMAQGWEYSERMIRVSTVVAVIVGIGFVVFGVLAFLGAAGLAPWFRIKP